MRRIPLFLSVLALAITAIAYLGCAKSSDSGQDSGSATESSDEHGHGEHDEHSDAAGKSDMEKMNKGLASLSDEDRDSAMKQHVCPVSGEMLGTMGEPIKVNVNNVSVWICCNGCKSDLLADPEKYLEKIKK